MKESITYSYANVSTTNVVTPLSVQPFSRSSILQIINSSLASRVVLMVFKQSVVQPFLNETNFDSFVLANHRPISKLLFLSKLLEKSILLLLQPFLDASGILQISSLVLKLCTALKRLF